MKNANKTKRDNINQDDVNITSPITKLLKGSQNANAVL